MLAVVNKGHIGAIHSAGILFEKFGGEAAEGVQLHAGYEPSGGVLLLHGGNGGAELGGSVSEVFVDGVAGGLTDQLEAFAGAVEGLDGKVELLVGDAQAIAGIACCGEVQQVVSAENFQWHSFTIVGEVGSAVFHSMEGHVVGLLGNVGTAVFQCHVAHLGVVVAIDEPATGLYQVDKLGKLVLVYLKSGEDVNVVPLDAGHNGHMGLVEVKLGAAVDRRSEVFVPFDHHHLRGVAEAHHHLKTFQLRTYHIVGLDAAVLQHMQNHGRGGGLAVAAANDYAGLVLRLLVKVFGVAVYLDTQLLCPQQLGIVSTGMHTQHDGVEVGGDALGMPAETVGQEPVALEAAAGGVEDFVIGARDVVAFQVEGDGQVVHGAAADGYKMDVHFLKNRLKVLELTHFVQNSGLGDELFGVENIVFGDLFFEKMTVKLVGGVAYVAAGAVFEKDFDFLVVIVVGVVA